MIIVAAADSVCRLTALTRTLEQTLEGLDKVTPYQWQIRWADEGAWRRSGQLVL